MKKIIKVKCSVCGTKYEIKLEDVLDIISYKICKECKNRVYIPAFYQL